MGKTRFYMIDNLRAVLILLVVVGHFMEYLPFEDSNVWYSAIYSFHMPAFAFVSGLCFRRNRNKTFSHVILPYIVFQIVYLKELAWETETEIELQFSTPNWILWYLLALAMWQMMVNVLKLTKLRGAVTILISFAIALWIGNDETISYYFSLSRIITFFPFFLMGAYVKENYLEEIHAFLCDKQMRLWRVLLVIPALVTQYLLYRQQDLTYEYFFYGAKPYDEYYTRDIRLMIYVAAIAMIIALCVVIPKREIAIWTGIGQNTMAVYLGHGLLIRYVMKKEYIVPIEGWEWWQILLLSMCMVVLLSVVSMFARYLCKRGKELLEALVVLS